MTWHRIDDPENPPPKDGSKFAILDRDDLGEWMAATAKYDVPSDCIAIDEWDEIISFHLASVMGIRWTSLPPGGPE